MNKLPCEVIMDLLPSYVEKLTSEKTTACVEAHLEGCEDCRKALAALTGRELEALAPEERAEVDFLKKQKRRTVRVVLLAVLGVVVLGLGVLAARLFLIGEKIDYYAAVCDLRVDGNRLQLNVQLLDSGTAIREVKAEEKDGVVTLSATGVLAGLRQSGSAQVDLTFDNEIKTVCFGDRVLWSEGREVSELASALYAARNPYVGDMSANERIAQILKLRTRFGEYENELSTAEEPYGWTLRLKTDFHEGTWQKDQLEADVLDCGQLLLATVENLGWVRVEYTVDGEPEDWLFTASRTSYAQLMSAKHCFSAEWAKDCYNNVAALDEHINRETELTVRKAPERVFEDAAWGVDLIVDRAVTTEVSLVHASLHLSRNRVASGFLTRAGCGDTAQAGEDAVLLRVQEAQLRGVEIGEEYRLEAVLVFPDGEGKDRTVEYTLPYAPGEIVTLYLRKTPAGEYIIEP